MCELLGMECNVPDRHRLLLRWPWPRAAAAPVTTPMAGAWRSTRARRPGCSSSRAAAAASPLARFVRDHPIKTLLAVAHVRKRTRGPVSLVNTHPFVRELWGRQFVFAHNGTIKGARRLTLGRFRPVGTTDSEHAFCALLGAVAHEFDRYPASPTALAEAVAAHGARIGRGGTFNFLMADGRQLIARCSTRLHHIIRQAPFARATLADEDLAVDFAAVTTPRDSRRGGRDLAADPR
jgi:predicted glutamine amidotransferase